MNNITNRTIVTVILAILLLAGTGFFVFKLVTNGSEWASFSANSHLYSNGILNSGQILDRDGETLAAINEGVWTYNNDQVKRMALLHTVGVPDGTIATGAITRFAAELTGYNLITGAKHIGTGGMNLFLTVDSDVCKTAYEALGSYKGAVCVYNYLTGEILCCVSTPTYDPANPPQIAEGDPAYDGVYLNRCFSSAFTPGSTFKLITLTAALNEIDDVEAKTWPCTGTIQIGNQPVTCTGTHETIDIKTALNVSCNDVFGQIAVEVGRKKMAKYVKSTGLTSSYNINGISTRPSTFDFSSKDDGDLAWAGVGQGKDLVNPVSMMVYMGAIANGGKAAEPQIISKYTLRGGLKTSVYIRKMTEKLVDEATAAKVSDYMKSNVKNTYGEYRFPGLDIYAKTGTAEVATGGAANSWFVGFIKNTDAPLAFVVYAEGGGSGSSTAATIASTVLQKAIAK